MTKNEAATSVQECITSTNEGALVKQFNTALKAAVSAQGKANTAWHTAQKHAVTVAVHHRNMTPLSELYAAAYASKAVRARELLSFVCMLGGDSEGGPDCVVTWDSKKLTFGLKKGQSMPSAAIDHSNDMAWFEWAKPQAQTLPSFKTLLGALKKAAAAHERGELTVKSDKEVKALAAMLKAVTDNLGADALN